MLTNSPSTTASCSELSSPGHVTATRSTRFRGAGTVGAATTSSEVLTAVLFASAVATGSGTTAAASSSSAARSSSALLRRASPAPARYESRSSSGEAFSARLDSLGEEAVEAVVEPANDESPATAPTTALAAAPLGRTPQAECGGSVGSTHATLGIPSPAAALWMSISRALFTSHTLSLRAFRQTSSEKPISFSCATLLETT
mmetsp:Transcript_27466/g.60109  ORF Transcript_27466/g.60109 Transcript_27466/m.60109 type:complete len:202 (-) Transcript_27466:233-838(-)